MLQGGKQPQTQIISEQQQERKLLRKGGLLLMTEKITPVLPKGRYFVKTRKEFSCIKRQDPGVHLTIKHVIPYYEDNI